MTEYKILSRKTFAKESSFIEDINKEARNGWKVINAGYSIEGSIVRVMLEHNSNIY